MRSFISCLVVLGLVASSLARPPTKQKAAQPRQPETKAEDKEWDLGVEYNRYLQEVVQVLESDPEFRKKLEDSDHEKIKDGSIANELDFVNHNVRSKLDDIKRKELDRLRHLAMKQFELSNGIDRQHIKIPQHLDIESPQFDKQDLKKLISTVTQDLEEADRKRREDFKKYEMEKKFEEEERLKHIEDETKREEERKKIEEAKAKHKQHEKPHHPMSKDQLEEVWEEQDHMRPQDWDPKTFFAMHDLNGDGHWDEVEVKALFKKELDKVYDKDAPEDDMREREEEMERMREHVFKESDKNADRLISYDEFLTETKRDEFNQDEGWNTLDEGGDYDDFSPEEFRAFELQRQREIQDLLNRGIVPPGYPYYGDLPPGSVPFQPNPMGGVPGQPAFRPDQQHPGAVGSVPGQPAFGGSQPGSLPQQQFAPGQVPQQGQQQFQGQVPQQAYQPPQPVQQAQQPMANQQQQPFQAPQPAAGQQPQLRQQPAAGQQQQYQPPQPAGGQPQFRQQQAPQQVQAQAAGQQAQAAGQQAQAAQPVQGQAQQAFHTDLKPPAP